MLRMVAVTIAGAMVVSSCTGGGPSDRDDSASSTITTVPSTTIESPPDTEPPAPDPLFAAVNVPEFVTEGDRISISEAVPLGGTSWLIGGVLDQPEARRFDAVVIEIDLEDPAAATTTILPAGDSVNAHVNDLVINNGAVLAAGRISEGGVSRPVLWEQQGATWTEVPLQGPPGSRAFALSPDGTIVLGGVVVDGVSEPIAWQLGPSGWQPLEVASGTGDLQPWLVSVAATESQTVAVGRIYDPVTDKASPAIWTLGAAGFELATEANTSLPEFGRLNGIIVTEAGFIAVGSRLDSGVFSPISATTSAPLELWEVTSPIIDTADRYSPAGFGFRTIIAENGALWASLNTGFLQTISRSSDGGRTWTELPEIFAGNGGQVSSNAFAVQNDVILLGGSDLLYASTPDGWDRVPSAALPRLGTSKQGVEIIQTDTGGFLLGGNSSNLDARGIEQSSLVVWSSGDGVSWERLRIDNPRKQQGVAFTPSPDGPIFFGSGLEMWHDQITGWSGHEGSDFWQSRSFALDDEVGRAVLVDAASDGLTTTAVGLQVLISADGSSRYLPLAQVIDAEGNFGQATIDSAAPADANSEVSCVVALDGGGYFGVVQWSPRGYDVITSVDGSAWESVGATDPFGELDIIECGTGSDGSWLVTATDSDNRPYLSTSSDGVNWTSLLLPSGSGGSPYEVTQIDDVTLLLGSTRATDNASYEAAIWFESEDGWNLIGSESFTLGIKSDGYSTSTSAWSLAVSNDRVWVVGYDNGRIGLWSADREQFLAAIGS